MRTETKVGAFFIASIAVAAFLILKMEKISLFGGNGRGVEYVTTFDQVAGLTPNSKVRMAGVPIGEVKQIALLDGRAQVTFRIYEPVQLYGNAYANLNSIGILGEKYVELVPGTPTLGPFSTGQALPGQSGANLDNLMKTFESVGQDVKGITASLNKSIGGEEGSRKLDDILQNVRSLTGELRAIAAENRVTIHQSLENVQSITADLHTRLPKVAQQFEDLGNSLNALVNENRPEVKGIVGDVRKLAQSFQSTSDNLKLITQKLNHGEGTLGKLLTDETTIKKINAAVDSVNEMMGGIRTMELRLDLNASRWTRRGDSLTGLDIDIAPRKDYWYNIGLHSTPDGKVMDSSRTVKRWDVATGTYKDVLEQTRTVTRDQAFTASATFNKRFGDHLVLSGGILENRGGVGGEFRTLDDRFRAGVMAYDFSKRDGKSNPRVRATVSYQFLKGLYVQAGLQDAANKDLRSFFAGGGIRWKDEDLKKLMGLAGAAK